MIAEGAKNFLRLAIDAVKHKDGVALLSALSQLNKLSEQSKTQIAGFFQRHRANASRGRDIPKAAKQDFGRLFHALDLLENNGEGFAKEFVKKLSSGPGQKRIPKDSVPSSTKRTTTIKH